MKRNLKALTADQLLEYYYKVQSGQGQATDEEQEDLKKEMNRWEFRELFNGELEFILQRMG